MSINTVIKTGLASVWLVPYAAAWSLVDFIDNLTEEIKILFGSLGILAGIVLIAMSFWQVFKKFGSQGQGSWIKIVAMFCIGAMLLVGSWAFLDNLANAAYVTINDLGK